MATFWDRLFLFVGDKYPILEFGALLGLYGLGTATAAEVKALTQLKTRVPGGVDRVALLPEDVAAVDSLLALIAAAPDPHKKSMEIWYVLILVESDVITKQQAKDRIGL